MAVSEKNTRLSVTVSLELEALLKDDADKASHSVSRQIAIILENYYQSALIPQANAVVSTGTTKRTALP